MTGNCILQPFQCFCDDEGSQSQLLVPLLSDCDKMYPRESEEEVLYSAPTNDLESFYSPLGEPDLKDLPSFAYQISRGMVTIYTYAACSRMCTGPYSGYEV